jgi:chemotaxis protein methyltransferase CheR
MPLSREDLDAVRSLVKERSAIVLEPEKAYLIEARLQPVARREGFAALHGLIQAMRSQPYGALRRKVVEAMTTNETSWFRDRHPFDALRTTVLPELIARRATERTLNIWCGAASSGQEPYSIMMVIRHHFPELESWKIRLIASDLSTEMLQRTRNGRYTQLEVNRGLPAQLLVRFFDQETMTWRVRPTLREAIEVEEINLAGPWPALPQMDIIFMRNVLIYFDVSTKKLILAKVQRLIRPDGYLFLGGAETTLNLNDEFRRVAAALSGCYQLRSAVVQGCVT